jgi:Predicted O-methyltransferase
MTDAKEKYIRDFSAPVGEALEWLERQTHLRTSHARMLSGRTEGSLLRHFAMMIKPSRVLELGTFTGYSAICLASGMPEGSVLDAIEINDELEDLIREGFEMAGVAEKIDLMFGDAKALLPQLDHKYDLVYIDANKREYSKYLDLVIDKVNHGGYIIADNVLWDGKVYAEKPDCDAQTQGILSFNAKVAADERLDNLILPIRDGMNIIRVR